MSHNLNVVNGKASFAAVGEVAWHGLGQYVNEAMTAAQAIELGGLDYKVVKSPVYTPTQKDPLVEIPDVFATVRQDTGDILGIVSEKYQILQNKEAFGFFDSIVDSGEAMYQTAGVLGNGERVFITAKLPSDIEVRGELIEQYLLLSTGHDGRNSTQVGFSAIRVVCQNTLRMALGGLSNSVSILHLKNIKEKLKAAHEVMGISSWYSTLVQDSFNKMAAKKISDAKLRSFIENVMKPQSVTVDTLAKDYSARFVNQVDSIMDFAKTHPTQQGAAAGTVWGAYNSISGYYSYLKEYKSQDEKMQDLYFKYGGKKIELAYDLATAML